MRAAFVNPFQLFNQYYINMNNKCLDVKLPGERLDCCYGAPTFSLLATSVHAHTVPMSYEWAVCEKNVMPKTHFKCVKFSGNCPAI